MYFQKCFSICIFILSITVLTQLASAKQPSYLEEGKERSSQSEEFMLRQKMEQVRKEINRLNEELEANFKRLHELEKELKRIHIENRKRELEHFVDDAIDKIEDLKRSRAPEEKIERLAREVEERKRELEELHRQGAELFDEYGPPERRHGKVIVFRLHHAPADHIADIIEDFLTSENGIVRADERTNSLIIRDIEPSLHDIDMIVRELDVPEGPRFIEPEIMMPERGKEIANVLDITEESIIVNFPEHSEWPKIDLWIPFRQQGDDGWVRDEEITEKVRQLEVNIPIEVEWERDDGRFWIVWFEPLRPEIPIEEIQELMEHALSASSPEEALERFNNVLEHDPECRTIYGKAAQIMVGVNLMKLGKLEEAENAIRIGLNLFPEDDLNVWTLTGYEALGDIYRECNDLDQAVEVYQHAIRLYVPDELRERDVETRPIIIHQKSVRIKLAQIYIQIDQKDLARETLESAIELEQEIPRLDARAHLLLGKLQMENGNLEEAKTEFQKVLVLAEKPESEVSEDDIEQAKDNLEKIEESK